MPKGSRSGEYIGTHSFLYVYVSFELLLYRVEIVRRVLRRKKEYEEEYFIKSRGNESGGRGVADPTTFVTLPCVLCIVYYSFYTQCLNFFLNFQITS